MTVCVAAIAADEKAIVCVADKALSYAGYIQWDADSSKILKLNPSGSLVMLSDEGTGPRVLTALFEKANEIGGCERSSTIAACEEQYISAVAALVEITFLKPRLLNSNKYIKAALGKDANHLIRGLADEIKAFDMKCDLLVCGFDSKHIPFILNVESPGIATDYRLTGFHAIGSGSEKAVSRLLFSEYKRKHPLQRVLYDCFDAKANAEMVTDVGYEWDAYVIVDGKAEEVPKDIKELIEKVWGKYNRSPFEKYDRKEHENPPRDWPERLETFAKTFISN